jgi:hypothetical protein
MMNGILASIIGWMNRSKKRHVLIDELNGFEYWLIG